LVYEIETEDLYEDANNQYGWAMSQFLPSGEFTEDPDLEMYTADYIQAISDDSPSGCFILGDFDYPSELHDLHNDYPMAPERMTGTYSQTVHDLMVKHDIKQSESLKLIPNLNDKKNYLVHYRLLKFYLAHGLVIRKIHRVIRFKQSPWLKTFIDFNTSERVKCSQAGDDIGKDFFKLMNNAVYGKTLENVRKHKDIQLFTDQKKAQKRYNKPNFKRDIIIKEDELVSIEMSKTCITMDKPVFIGFAVLELSKLLMYGFHYEVIKSKYGPRAKTLYTDTDSLVYEIETEDLYEDLKNMKYDCFDFSNYPKDHKCYSTRNDTVPGFFKDEAAGKPILEFIALRPKSYSFNLNGAIKKKSKGIPRASQAKITFDDYKAALFGERKEELVKTVDFNTFRSKLHVMNTIKASKIALSQFDDKRIILEDRINTLAIGHYLTR
jgi:hypothetical protein